MKRRLSLLLVGLVCSAPRVSAAQQCAGDVNGDAQVTVSEIMALVNSALNGCAAGSGCPYRFDRTTPRNQACKFTGTFNARCPSRSITVGFVTDQSPEGSLGVGAIITDPFIVFLATTVGATFAAISGWAMQTEGTEPTHSAGTIRLSADGSRLFIDPNTPPFSIDGCAFEHFEGRYEGMIAAP